MITTNDESTAAAPSDATVQRARPPSGRPGRADVCDVSVVHQEVVDRVTAGMEPPETLAWAADVLNALADGTRFRIARALLLAEELCVCDLSNVLGMTISAVSHHLRVLRGARVVKHRRAGQMVYYSIDDGHIRQIVETVLQHVQHE